MKFKISVAMVSAAMLTVNIARAATDITPTDTLSVSLDECIAIALDKNPTIKVADMEVTRVDYSKKETIG